MEISSLSISFANEDQLGPIICQIPRIHPVHCKKLGLEMSQVWVESVKLSFFCMQIVDWMNPEASGVC